VRNGRVQEIASLCGEMAPADMPRAPRDECNRTHKELMSQPTSIVFAKDSVKRPPKEEVIWIGCQNSCPIRMLNVRHSCESRNPVPVLGSRLRGNDVLLLDRQSGRQRDVIFGNFSN